MKRIKSIILAFENVEVCEIPVHKINQMYLTGIHYTINTLGYNLTSKNAHADCFFMVLLPSVKDTITSDGQKLFERVSSSNDIASIIAKCADGEEEEIYLYWKDADSSGWSNKCQKSRILNNGCLAVYVGKRGNLEREIKKCKAEELDIEFEEELSEVGEQYGNEEPTGVEEAR